MSEEGKKINIDGLLIVDINIRNDFEAMDNEYVNNNNKDIAKPLINCARALIENRSELIKFLLPYYLCRKEIEEQSKDIPEEKKEEILKEYAEDIFEEFMQIDRFEKGITLKDVADILQIESGEEK
jgi:hypothetical protein